MAEIIHFTPKPELSAAENLAAFVEVARTRLTIFGADLPFDAMTWDTGDAGKQRGLSHQIRITFSTLDTRTAKQPTAMAEPFGSFAKACIRFLQGLRPTKNQQFRVGALRALECDVDLEADWLLIVDEASMLDLPTLYRILRLMRPGQGLLLVGDPGQLPPIGFGLTFHALAASDLIPRVELTEVHRQAASTGIRQASATIREGRVPALAAFDGRLPGVSFVDVAAGAVGPTGIDLVNELGGSGEAQIVAAIKQGPGGVHTLNAAFHDLLGDRAAFAAAVAAPPMPSRRVTAMVFHLKTVGMGG